MKKLLFLLHCAFLLLVAPAVAMPEPSMAPWGFPQGLPALSTIPGLQATGTDSVGFGGAVALSGDIALVGAPLRDVGANGDQGAVYVFVRSGSTWSQQGPPLTANDGGAGDHFGCSVALDGDTVLVGAMNHGIGTSAGQGAAYVFVRSGSTWTQQGPPLTANDGGAEDAFGGSVALSGGTALVGAREHDVAAQDDQGAAYVFVRSGSTWTQQGPALTADDGAALDYFGSSVALDGETALVGAPMHAGWAGEAYVFVRSGSTWSRQGPALTADVGATAYLFGWSAALDGDTAVVPAPGMGLYGESPGEAYVFVRSGGTWSRQGAPLPGDRSGTMFGASVALSTDTVLMGAPSTGRLGGVHDSGPGAAYVFVRSGGTWTQQGPRLTADEGSEPFGSSVAVSGDSALVGPTWDPYIPSAMTDSAYVFVRSGSSWGIQAILTFDGSAPDTSPTLAPAANTAGWNRSPVTVTLSAQGGSGIVATEYRLRGAADWTTYDRPFLVTAQGRSTYEYRSRDLSGNLEVAKSFSIKIDSRRPVTRVRGATVRQGGRARFAYRVSDLVPGCGWATVKLKIFKGEKLSRTVKLGRHRCNAKQICRWRCTLPKGDYAVRVYATDIAGNAQRRAGRAHLTVR